MFSNSAKYAIKAVLYLAVHSSEEKRVIVGDIAKPINVPKAYIAKILQALSKKDLISSVRGPKGGFFLNDKQFDTKIMDIIEAVDGEDRINSCLLSLDQCNSDNPCSLHHIVYREKNFIKNKLEQTSLMDLKKHLDSGKSVLPL